MGQICNYIAFGPGWCAIIKSVEFDPPRRPKRKSGK
jgi:hypothetical protein